MPLHDWSLVNGKLVAKPASFGGAWKGPAGVSWARLYKSTATIGTNGSFTTRFQIHCMNNRTVADKGAAKKGKKKGKRKGKKESLQAGIWFGLRSRTPSPQNVWIHPQDDFIYVGLTAAAHLVVGDHISQLKLDPFEPTDITIRGMVGASADELAVTATQKGGNTVDLKTTLPAGKLRGSLCLVAQKKGATWNFGQWSLEGKAVVKHPERAVGPIIWTQYTLQDDGTLKLLAQMVPLEKIDSQKAVLQFKEDEKWKTITTATLEPLSSTFLFRLDKLNTDKPIAYRVQYTHRDFKYHWAGAIRSIPTKNEFTLGVFNCDHGELFPQDTMVRNVTIQNPDMLFFAGDQIYGNMDNVKVIRKPLESARLSYLSKYYQFGLTWRSLLKDRPSVIIPDDHDVFMGNVWGDRGRGYIMPPKRKISEWASLILMMTANRLNTSALYWKQKSPNRSSKAVFAKRK